MFLWFLLYLVEVNCIKSNHLAIYTNGNYEIVVKDVDTRKTIKKFTIQVENPTGGVCVDYKRDLLFFAEKGTIYRIHMVNDNGTRQISGKGELFTNKFANHLEISYQFNGSRKLIFDDHSRMLYYIDDTNKPWGMIFLKIDPESMKKVFEVKTSLKFSVSKFVLCNDMLYAYTNEKDGYIYNITLRELGSQVNYSVSWHRLNEKNPVSPSFAIDQSTNRLFYAQKRNILGVFDGNLAITPMSSMKRRIIMADSSFTKDISSLTVYGNIVVWTSQIFAQTSLKLPFSIMYIGRLNENMNFMVKQDVHVLDKPRYRLKYDNIIILEIDHSNSAFPTRTTTRTGF